MIKVKFYDLKPEGTGIEFYHLKLRPEYPRIVKAVAFALLRYDTEAKRLYFDRPEGSQWVASLWIRDEWCQIDLAVVLKEGKLEFIEGFCLHGEDCPNVEKLKRAVLESEAFAQLREDIARELHQRAVVDLHRADHAVSPKD